MQRVYKTWKIFVKILLFSLGFYLLMLIPNALYDNTFAKGLGFLPYDCEVERDYGTSNYFDWYHSVGNSGDRYLCNKEGYLLDTVKIKTIDKYGFNYNTLVFKMESMDGKLYWMQAIDGKTLYDKTYIRLSENEAFSIPRLVWINVHNSPFPIFDIMDLINRTIVMPFGFLISVVLSLMLLFGKFSIKSESRIRFIIAVVFVFGFPLITTGLRYLVVGIWKIGLLIYTYI